jgi:GxxExxY protein
VVEKRRVNVSEIRFKEESYQIMGACFEVYNQMGAGFLEAVYQECLTIEFDLRVLPFIAHSELALQYKGKPLVNKYVPDFICFGKIILEIKSVSELTDQHRAQVHNYLRATGFQLGLLVNFGSHPKIEYERIIR